MDGRLTPAKQNVVMGWVIRGIVRAIAKPILK
jgi:hypothetical protein